MKNHGAAESNPLCILGDYKLLFSKLQLEDNLLMDKNPTFTLLMEEKKKISYYLTHKQEELTLATLALGLLFSFLYNSLLVASKVRNEEENRVLKSLHAHM